MENKPQKRCASSNCDAGEPPATPAAANRTLQGRILLADDSVQCRRLIACQLQGAGAEVDVAEDGWIACEKATEAMAAGRPYSLILMDMQMPELDGYSAAAVLRSKGYNGAIVALTADDLGRDRERGLDSGCNDYLIKPIDKRRLLAVASIYLAGSPNGESKLAPDGDPSLAEPAGLDPAIAQLLPAFVADLPSQVGQLLSALQQQDLANLKQLLHQVKGAAGMYGFEPITDRAAQAEQELFELPSFVHVTEKVQDVVELIRAVKGYDRGRESILGGGARS